MSQYEKICPACGEKNTNNFYSCPCGYDLSGVKRQKIDNSVNTSDSTALSEAMTTPVTAQSQDDLITCPKCGNPNENYLSLCKYCQKELPVKSQPNTPQNEAVENEPISKKMSDKKLMIVVGNQQFTCRDGDVLGRAGTVACKIFSGIGTVSGRHVSVQSHSGEWWLTNLPLQPGKSAKNITFVNGCELPIGDSVQLTGDTTLQMSSKCTVMLRVVL